MSGNGGGEMQSYERLRQCSEYMDLDELGVPAEARRVFNQAMGEYIADDAHGFWLEPECRDGHCDPGELAFTLGSRIAALGSLYNSKSTQSPIEDQMAGALLWLGMDWAGFPEADYLNGPADYLRERGPSDALEFYITPQAKIEGHKADFLLWFINGRHVAGLVIECDGHAFHEKTKEQASKDKRRDRDMLKAGYPVMRFSGSDIYRDPLDCAEQVRVVLSGVLDRISKDSGVYSGTRPL